MASPIRLDKAVSQVTGLSRSDAKRAAKAQRISVNDQVVTDPAVKVQASDSLCLDGVPLLKPGPRYIMLNKPMGYVSATKDPKHPTVLDLIEEPNTGRLHIAGRLDIDTTGLVLLTDDGQWSHKVTSPNHHCAKTYYAQLADKIEATAVAKFAKGIWLNSERRRTRPARLQILFANEARVTIGEGRYHQVKRMFAALGNKVLALHREKIGDISLDEALREGEYRFLSPDEIASVK
ncbi:16S rRNA pseudouridine(516) synthase RsuA [Microbulbifer sp. 2205BS26-8]|uniref:16S rRNA pseudouridine(516) synthase RsuA n=1 Tax=Microbulbifer sp. 2205BS26-8 TaxID=3064386 RepID=UPI00273D550C|nr:16S rRNA pseudouridine(516) synthase RsuA [Microbulbifer sp. 2205BS26-8]MDP5211162.1 16S rRNA pseudouridine(516) synthase RsuA [Microbulbifer sp. 2205BS26-8]